MARPNFTNPVRRRACTASVRSLSDTREWALEHAVKDCATHLSGMTITFDDVIHRWASGDILPAEMMFINREFSKHLERAA